MAETEKHDKISDKLGDFTTDHRVAIISLMGLVAGTGGVAAGWVLLRLISIVNNLAYYGAWSTQIRPAGGAVEPNGHLALWTVFIPMLGALIIGLMARYGTEKIRGHGIPEALEAIILGNSRLNLKTAILKPISSAISIGTGGPFGAEGPIIMTGGAIGSLFAQFFELTDMERKTLLVAGACAGMTAVFGTPVAAILLAVELLLFELKPRSFLPVVVACITAAVERRYLLSPQPLFPYTGGVIIDPLHAVGWAGLGLIAGIGSALLTLLVYAAEDGFAKLRIHWMWWPVLGGAAVGVGGLIDPRALGVGYPNIAHMLSGGLAGASAMRLMMVKGVIWAVALGSGTSGGVLAPLLMIGGGLGAVLAPFLPAADPGFWAVLGMSAMMGGTMRAPLTAGLFAVELTGNHVILLPVITACAASYAITVLFMKRSILTEKLARRGHHLTREYSVDLAALARVQDIMTTEVETLNADLTIGDTIDFFLMPTHRHRAYPVIDGQGQFIGLVSRSGILEWIGTNLSRKGSLHEALKDRATVIARPGETVSTVAVRMLARESARIPVVDAATKKLLGIISRADVMKLRWREFEAETIRTSHIFPRKNRRPTAADLPPTSVSAAESARP